MLLFSATCLRGRWWRRQTAMHVFLGCSRIIAFLSTGVSFRSIRHCILCCRLYIYNSLPRGFFQWLFDAPFLFLQRTADSQRVCLSILTFPEILNPDNNFQSPFGVQIQTIRSTASTSKTAASVCFLLSAMCILCNFTFFADDIQGVNAPVCAVLVQGNEADSPAKFVRSHSTWMILPSSSCSSSYSFFFCCMHHYY